MSAVPLYLELEPHPAFVFLHLPDAGARSDTGVLLCPPFGWDEVCSYRSRRAWAEHLAANGHPALRLDFPGSGDSAGSPSDPGRLDAWTAAAGQAAVLLRSRTDCRRVVAIGIGLGGLVAVRSVAHGGEIDDLVLWAVPARGRSLVRELEAFARLEAEWTGAAPPGEGDYDGLAAGGFRLSSETMGSLRELDLTQLELADTDERRVLLLDRDGIGPDKRLLAHLEGLGVEVTVAPGEGYARMMDDPRWSRRPEGAFATTSAWLREPARVAVAAPGTRGGGRSSAPPAADASDTLQLTVNGNAIRETPTFFDLEFGRLFGILAEPVDEPRADVCAVLLNAGPVRRIGPNRVWVEIARRWAARGVPTLRVDMNALGDSEGDEARYASEHAYYVPELSQQTLRLLDELEHRGFPPRFVLAGLCSGAYWSFRAAECDPRVAGAFMINLWCFFWSRALFLDREWQKAPRLLRKRENVYHAAGMLALGVVRTPRRAWLRRRRRHAIEVALGKLDDRRAELLFVFSENEPLADDLETERALRRVVDAAPSFMLVRMPTADHTLRDPPLQRRLLEVLDAGLGRLVGG